MSLRRYSFRSLVQRPLRTFLTVLSIVIGVAAVVSVSITTATTRSGYKQMFAMVTGRTALEISAAGSASFSDEIVAEMETLKEVRTAAPVIHRMAILRARDKTDKDTRVQVQILGVEPKKDAAVRDFKLSAGRELDQGKEVLIDEALATRLGVAIDDNVRIMMGRAGLTSFKVVGLSRVSSGVAMRHASVVMMPINTAQTLLKEKGKIDTVQIVLAEGAEQKAVQALISPMLPEGVSVRMPVTNSPVMEETLLGAEQGLQISSLFSLLLATFIILNTFFMSVGERRRQLAILRAIGATKQQIMRTILIESLLLGLIGTAIGIGLGLLAAFFLSQSLSDILKVPLPALQLSPWVFVQAVVFGLAMSLVGSGIPARQATLISPLEGMDRVSRKDLGASSLFYSLLGLALLVVSGGVIVAAVLEYVSIDLAIDFAPLAMVGLVLLSPVVLTPFAMIVAWVIGPFAAVESRLALLQLLRHRVRTMLTLGVLFVAGAAGTAMAYSILDNVGDVKKWYESAITADFFVRAMMPDMATGGAADLPDELGEQLRNIQEFTSIEAASFSEVRSGEQKFVAISREFPGDGPLPFDLISGNVDHLREQLKAGKVVIGSVLAQRMTLKMGDKLKLDTLQGAKELDIVGVTNDYIGGGLSVYLQREVAHDLLGVDGVDAYVLRARREDLPKLREQLEAICEQHGVLLHSAAEITGQIDTMIIGIDGFLWGLVVLGFVVASFGVVNTLTMNVLEQTRELGMLRIIAMTKRQVRRTILIQALIIGTVGLIPGVFFGVGFAWVMNFATAPSLGHIVAFGVHPWLLLGILVSSLSITLLAAWMPARRAANLDVIAALHYE